MKAILKQHQDRIPDYLKQHLMGGLNMDNIEPAAQSLSARRLSKYSSVVDIDLQDRGAGKYDLKITTGNFIPVVVALLREDPLVKVVASALGYSSEELAQMLAPDLQTYKSASMAIDHFLDDGVSLKGFMSVLVYIFVIKGGAHFIRLDQDNSPQARSHKLDPDRIQIVFGAGEEHTVVTLSRVSKTDWSYEVRRGIKEHELAAWPKEERQAVKQWGDTSERFLTGIVYTEKDRIIHKKEGGGPSHAGAHFLLIVGKRNYLSRFFLLLCALDNGLSQ